MTKRRSAVVVGAAVVILVAAGGAVYTSKIRRDTDLSRGPLGNLTAALQRVKDLPNLKNPQAQQEVVAALVRAGDISRCSAAKGVIIDGIDYEEVCRSNIILKRAQQSLDPSWCSQLDNKIITVANCQNSIVRALALKAKDENSCSALDQNLKQECLQIYLTAKAVRSGNSKDCGAIAAPDEKTRCRDLVLMGQVISKGVTASCYKLSVGLRKGCPHISTSIIRKTNGAVSLDCSSLSDPLWQSMCVERNSLFSS